MKVPIRIQVHIQIVELELILLIQALIRIVELLEHILLIQGHIQIVELELILLIQVLTQIVEPELILLIQVLIRMLEYRQLRIVINNSESSSAATKSATTSPTVCNNSLDSRSYSSSTTPHLWTQFSATHRYKNSRAKLLDGTSSSISPASQSSSLMSLIYPVVMFIFWINNHRYELIT